MAKINHIPCKIERGGFAGERTFTIQMTNGEALIGAAYIEYFCDENQRPLTEDEPPPGVIINGYVACREIRRQDDGTVIVEVPTSDIIAVPTSDLIAC